MSNADKFVVFQDAQLSDEGKVFRVPNILTDIVEVPASGFRLITWAAEHIDRGWESGTMLVSRRADEPDLCRRHREEDVQSAKNSVAEVLWGRGFVGDFRLVVAL